HLLGLAVCAMTPTAQNDEGWFRRETIVRASAHVPRENATPLVVDLASLWAGPLCAHLLQMLGARVIKVESTQRPDGARFGEASFYNVLNANKESVALDLNSDGGRAQLRQLLLHADIVIEASRPRALRHMNIVAEEIIAQNPALTWISITGYGRAEPQANWVAFGDDAGVAAGLSQMLFDITGEAMFCGDAIADPLTGMHAALAAWAGYLRGGGDLISLSLRDVVRHCMHAGGALDAQSLRDRYRDWMAVLETSGERISPPRARVPVAAARSFGIDTPAVLAEFGIAC
ncbi:MAG TPA: CoA transferase, partial [Spongiibacteraceae bacterium]|nr:CoA transferase [Spongiibacteraceae bacterium]